MNKKKICFVIPEYNRDTPTHFSYLYDFMELLGKEYEIFLVAEKGAGKISGVADYYIQKWNFLPFRVLENLFILMRARFRGYSHFYIHYSFLSAFHAACITRFWGGRTWYWNCGSPWLYKQNFLRAVFEKLVYRSVNFLVTGTDGLRSEYAHQYKIPISKIVVLPNWINLEKVQIARYKLHGEFLKQKLNIPQNAKVMLFVHRLSKRKGAHYLPEILNQLKNENVFLLVIGDGPEKQNTQSLIADYRLRDKAKFVGWIPQSEVINYFVIADVFLLPSEEEGFPHVILEAMAVGVPFVSFDVGGISEIIPFEARHFLVPLGNIGKFSDWIKELLNLDEVKRNNLRDSLSKWVRQFDIKNIANRFKKIIENLLDVVAGEDQYV